MKNSIKIWPTLNDMTQALLSYSTANLNVDNVIHLDFSNVKKVNSSGATLTLVRLIKIIQAISFGRWNYEKPECNIANDCFNTIGFYEIISNSIKNKDMFWPKEEIDITEPYYLLNSNNTNITSFPIYNLNHDNKIYREVVENFTDWIIEILLPYKKKYNFRLNILVKLLKEIAKNSEDHTKDNAFFGIDIIEAQNNTNAELIFSFCDLGFGIHENIKEYIKDNPEYRDNAYEKFGIVDSYYNAFKPGFSTSKNTKNKGIGMSMILDCTQILNIELSFFDARSRGFIPPENTHEEIRRNFWDTGNKVGFNYYGRLNLVKH